MVVALRRLAGVCLAVLLLAACGGTSTPHVVATHTAKATPLPTTPTPLPPIHFDFALPPVINANAAYVYDHASGQVIYSLAGDQELPMASTTKMMTAVVAILEGNLDQVVPVTADIRSLDPTASIMCCPNIQVGEKYTLRELLYGLLLPSGADAALLIADAVAGGETPFVQRMNAVATWLGLQHTHFANEDGLDAPDHYSSAHDLARLADFAMSLPVFRQVVATVRATLPSSAAHPAITLESTNQLLTTSGALKVDGVKTGFTGNAGYCVVVDAREGGREVLAVVLGDDTTEDRFTDATALLQWAYTLPSPSH